MPSFSPKHILVFTKPVSQILLWVTLSSALFYTALFTWPRIISKLPIHKLNIFWEQVIVYISVTLIFSFFPLGGFLGDVCFGRYRAVETGLFFFSVSQVLCTIGTLLLKAEMAVTLSLSLLIISFVLLVIGFSLFCSNILQFGLDQLIEKPSESMGVFAHWVVWALKAGISSSYLLFDLSFCGDNNVSNFFHNFLFYLPACLMILFMLCLLLNYCTRHHFNRDRVKYNAYKMIFKVLNFARKNKYPVGPVSAFAHCYDYRPSRLDYAKERYGGPFTTSDVEDVKAFKNVFLVLLALGPVFTLGIGTESYLFNKLASHATNTLFNIKSCTNYTDSGLYELGVLLAMPLYMWLVYCVLRNRTPKILHRLAVAAFIYILAVVSMLATDLTGHILLNSQHNRTQVMCMFVQDEQPQHTLELHWSVVIVPRFFKSFGHILMLATAFEFISAQSPHTMKGVLVGTFFAIFGAFDILSAIFIVPFSLHSIWKDGYLEHHPPVVSCGFGYYLVCITVAMIGFILFIIAVKRYKYRRRDEEPYSQACVEEIFARRVAFNPRRINRSEYTELPGSV